MVQINFSKSLKPVGPFEVTLLQTWRIIKLNGWRDFLKKGNLTPLLQLGAGQYCSSWYFKQKEISTALIIEFGNPPKCQQIMISLILDYKRGKLPYKRFQLSFPAHHKTLLKINEDQSIITNKFNPLFWEEGTG